MKEKIRNEIVLTLHSVKASDYKTVGEALDAEAEARTGRRELGSALEHLRCAGLYELNDFEAEIRNMDEETKVGDLIEAVRRAEVKEQRRRLDGYYASREILFDRLLENGVEEMEEEDLKELEKEAPSCDGAEIADIIACADKWAETLSVCEIYKHLREERRCGQR